MLEVYDDLKIVVENTLKAIDRAYNEEKININDYNEMNVVIENLNSYFIEMYGKYGDIDKEVSNMVKTFYDPNVEKRGIEKGIEKGMEKGMEQGQKKAKEEERIKDIERVKKLINKKFGSVNEKLRVKIENADIDHLGLVMENILDVETIEDIEKYLN